ncbi:DUF3616 domain-containing protein [Sinorhizobium meliloti]|nr:DUF3616 domain-containing protein [Sinorhizobium meliloti]
MTKRALLISGGMSLLIATSAASEGVTTIYHGLCEASAAVYLNSNHFVVASDETNILRIYRRGSPSSGIPLDFQAPSGFDKSDIEAAAISGDIVYWISSHSLNSDGEDKQKRKIFFATRIVTTNASPTLEWVGSVTSLRDEILEVVGTEKSDLNIEGMAVSPDGGLIIGLRNTVEDAAVVIHFENPAEVIAQPNTNPDLRLGFPLKLGGKGVRSIERVNNGYLIVGGPVSDTGGFSLYAWSGRDETPVELQGISFDSLRPEAMMQVPGEGTVQILSDDGSKTCDDEKSPMPQRAFRSLDLEVSK